MRSSNRVAHHLIPQSETAWVLFALAVVWFALFFRLGNLPLLQPDEGRNAEVAREMKESGAWLSPSLQRHHLPGQTGFLLQGGRAVAGGVWQQRNGGAPSLGHFRAGDCWGWRIFFAVAFTVTRCAVLAVIIIATMPLYVVLSRTVIFDMALAFFVSAAIFAGYRAEECEGKSRRNWYLLGAVAAGFATLVKGPVGFLIPGLVLFVFHRVEGRRGVWKRFFAPLNLLVFFGVTLPWFIGLSLQHPDFPYYGLVEESFHRFTTTTFHRSQPFYFYALIVAGLFLPWSFMLPEAGVAAWKNKTHPVVRRPALPRLGGGGGDFLLALEIKTAGLHFDRDGGLRNFGGAIFRAGAGDIPDGKAARIIGRAAITLAVLCLAVAIAAFILSPRMNSLAKPTGVFNC